MPSPYNAAWARRIEKNSTSISHRSVRSNSASNDRNGGSKIPRPELRDEDRDMLQLDSDDKAPKQYIRTMYDLIYLAFRTDSTRVATYQITNMADASSKAGKFPQLEGFKNSLHSLAHGWNKPAGADSWASGTASWRNSLRTS